MPRRPTRRYPHGDLSLDNHVDFIERYYATRPPGPFQPATKKGRQRGEISHLRGALRMKFPGWHSSIATIRAALKSKPEWAKWYDEVFEERKEKLGLRRAAKGRDPKTEKNICTLETARS